MFIVSIDFFEMESAEHFILSFQVFQSYPILTKGMLRTQGDITTNSEQSLTKKLICESVPVNSGAVIHVHFQRIEFLI